MKLFCYNFDVERFKLIVSIYLFLIKDNKILLLRRYNTGYEDGNYGLPAGHLEENESAAQALCREVKEEIDIKLKLQDLKLVHVMHRKESDNRESDNRIDLFFITKNCQGKPINNELEKCDDINWFSINHLPPNTIPYIRQAIGSYFKNVFYSESGWK